MTAGRRTFKEDFLRREIGIWHDLVDEVDGQRERLGALEHGNAPAERVSESLDAVVDALVELRLATARRIGAVGHDMATIAVSLEDTATGYREAEDAAEALTREELP